MILAVRQAVVDALETYRDTYLESLKVYDQLNKGNNYRGANTAVVLTDPEIWQKLGTIVKAGSEGGQTKRLRRLYDGEVIITVALDVKTDANAHDIKKYLQRALYEGIHDDEGHWVSAETFVANPEYESAKLPKRFDFGVEITFEGGLYLETTNPVITSLTTVPDNQ